MTHSIRIKALLLTVLLIGAFAVVWHIYVSGAVGDSGMDPEYAALMGEASKGGSNLPGPLDVAATVWSHITSPVTYPGTSQPGLLIQISFSIGRVMIGFGLAAAVAIPIGFAIGMSPLWNRALNPIIQVLKPISPLAWLPLALYTIKDAEMSAIFVIFICSLWPMMINTSFGVMSVRREWLNVARTLEVRPLRMALRVILPAAAPTIMTGMRISIGIAWLVIVAAEMLVGGTGIGYFVWNEWNNLEITNIITAILLVGIVGMLLDAALAGAARLTAYSE
ncbi:Nitrate transport permease protein NrtB [Stutzerimonas xanthomarina]|nr:Nitrate transport permease protein NrtB [Stutzerimonas xanthomarina]